MGTFTNQVQGLVSEEKQKRTEREQAKRRKRDVDYLKFQLKLSFETAFETLTIFGRDKKYKCNDVNDAYLHLLKSNIRDDVIYKVIAKQSWDDEELVRAIDNAYMSILSKAYAPYKHQETTIKDIERKQEKLLEQQLFKKFQYCFNQYNNENMYKKLIQKDIKNQILFDIIPNNNKLYYDLFFKYDNILNKTYKSIQKSINIKPQKQQQERKQKETKTKKSKLFILFSIVGIILLFILLLGVRTLAYILIPFIFIISFIIHYKK